MRSILATCLAIGAVAVGALCWYAWPHAVAERPGNPVGGKMAKSDEEWRQQLTPEQYRVTRKQGTERAFTGTYWDCKKDGVYHCVCCGQPLFDSSTKFESGTGWP